MKKIYSLCVAILVSAQTIFALGCTIDSTNTQFFYPSRDSIPCIEKGVSYSQVIQIHVPQTFDIGPFVGFPAGLIILTVDSLDIDSINGFPTGIGYNINPSDGHFVGGQNGCAYLSGTTNDTVGNYPLHLYGTIAVSGIPGGFGFPPDTTFPLQQAQAMSPMFRLSVNVINQGDFCQLGTGIRDVNADLASLIQLYPNPGNGIFNLKLDAAKRVKGQVVVVDVDGRKVYEQPIDATGLYSSVIDLSQLAKGLYTLQIRTDEGFTSKNIVIQ